MKKWTLLSSLVLLLLLLVSALCVDVFIPSTLTVTRVAPLRCRAVAAFSLLSDESKWKAWWPEPSPRAGFHIRKLSYQTMDIAIRQGEYALDSRMSVLPLGNQDSSVLHWETQLHCGWNPAARVRAWREASRLAGTMDEILLHASEFLGKQENIYGITIQETTNYDTLLVATRTVRPGLPTNEDIYSQIRRLRKYIQEAHVPETGFPMVNVTPMEEEPGAYRLMVALPTGGMVESSGDFSFMRLIPGKYLVTDVKGGPFTVAMALASMKDYIRDYQRTVMAIPFQSLVTDRMREPDSTRWVTRIYYPVM